MKQHKLISYLAGLASLSITASASAISIDFTTANLGVSGGDAYNSVSMSAGGIGVDVTAYTIENDGNGAISSSTLISGAGLGVYVSASDNLGVSSSASDGHDLDGGSSGSTSDLDEGLLFSFDQIVSLDFIDLDRFGSSDDFNLTVDGLSMLVDFDSTSTSPLAAANGSNTSEFNFFNVTGQEFLFWADGGSDDFRIDSMAVSAVPEPGSILLLGMGLIGLSFMRRAQTI